jgi:hypothetical protein
MNQETYLKILFSWPRLKVKLLYAVCELYTKKFKNPFTPYQLYIFTRKMVGMRSVSTTITYRYVNQLIDEGLLSVEKASTQSRIMMIRPTEDALEFFKWLDYTLNVVPKYHKSSDLSCLMASFPVITVKGLSSVDEETLKIVNLEEKFHYAVSSDLRWANHPLMLATYVRLAKHEQKTIKVLCLKNNHITRKRAKILRETGAQVEFASSEAKSLLQKIPWLGSVNEYVRFNMIDDKFLVVPLYRAGYEGPYYSLMIINNPEILNQISYIFDIIFPSESKEELEIKREVIRRLLEQPELLEKLFQYKPKSLSEILKVSRMQNSSQEVT